MILWTDMSVSLLEEQKKISTSVKEGRIKGWTKREKNTKQLTLSKKKKGRLNQTVKDE